MHSELPLLHSPQQDNKMSSISKAIRKELQYNDISSLSQAIRKELDALPTITPQSQQVQRKLQKQKTDARIYVNKKERRRKKLFPHLADAIERNLVFSFDEDTVERCLQIERDLQNDVLGKDSQKRCEATKQQIYLTSDSKITAGANPHVPQELVPELAAGNNNNQVKEKEYTSTKQSVCLFPQDIKNKYINPNDQQENKYIYPLDQPEKVLELPAGNCTEDPDTKYGSADIGHAVEHLSSLEGTVSNNLDLFSHNLVITPQSVGRETSTPYLNSHLNDHLHQTDGEDHDGMFHEHHDGMFHEVVDLSTDIDNGSFQNDVKMFSSADPGDTTIMEIESFIANPHLYTGPFEFLSWPESLSRLPKPSSFDDNTGAQFYAKSLPVFLVGCTICGPIMLMVFDSIYYEKCVATHRWWDTLFIRSFSQLLAHQWHNSKIKLVECTDLELAKDIIHTSIDLSSHISSVVAILYSTQHYVVVEYKISTKIFTVYDGLNYGLDHWYPHCNNIQARCGHPLLVPPLLQRGSCDSQPDSYNCGPLACLKLLHLISDGELGCTNQFGPNNWRSYIMEYYQKMLRQSSAHIFGKWRKSKTSSV